MAEFIPRRTRLALWVQREVGRVTSFFWIPASAFAMRYVMGYRIKKFNLVRPSFALDEPR